MSENSNPNHRPILVITFLAAHPTESFSLAEIARQLDLSKGSAHRVMIALTDSGVVARHPRHKTYSLGLSLVAIGQAALERYPGIELARQEMVKLAGELKVGCAVSAIVNNEYMLLAREGLPTSHDGLTLVGERRCVIPPIGVGQMAWRSPAEVQTYLESGAHYLNPAARHRLLEALPIIRRRGYAAAANSTIMRKIMQAAVMPIGKSTTETLAGIADKDLLDIAVEELQIISFDECQDKGINYISAPVFCAEGEVSFEMLMSGFPLDMQDQSFSSLAERLVLAADAVTRSIRGKKPSAS